MMTLQNPVEINETDPDAGLLHSPEQKSNGRWHKFAISILLILTILGFAARLGLSWISTGSTDAEFWFTFASLVRKYGVFQPYMYDANINHPPLPLLWSGLMLRLATFVNGGTAFPFPFPFLFRLAPIAADVGSCALLYRIWARRGDRRLAWLAAAAFAWNLDAIMDGAYHCNTDNICAFFTLLAAYQLADRRSFFMGGLALSAAINVKLVPIMLFPAFFSLCLSGADVKQFIKGLLIGAIPFVVVLCVTPVAFARNALFYTPIMGEWGVMLFPMYGQYIPIVAVRATVLTNWYHQHGKYLMLALTAGLGILSWRMPRWSAYQLGAMAWSVFLIFTPGWGLQYTVYIAPLLMATRLGRGTMYGLVAGLYLLTSYAGLWKKLPLDSIWDHVQHANPLSINLAFLAWSILVVYLASELWRGVFPKSGTRATAGNAMA